ncbi:MAG: TorF family putative porin [Desulfatirhabdiaceae bacterium]|nr:TorF family putative porin [Desulfatirhabdiaceae bacterium]
MKKNRHFLVCIVAATIIFSGQAAVLAAEEVKPTAAMDLGVFSQYIWRGFELSHNSVVVQPSATLAYYGFSFNVWGNLDTNKKTIAVDGSESSEAKYNETDLTFAYAKDLGPVKLGGGLIYYALDGIQDSQELFVSATLNTILNPTLSVYREIAHLPAWYVSLGISHSQEIIDKTTLDLAASSGYYHSDDSDFSEAKNPETKYRAFHNGLVSAGFTIPFGEYISVKPMIAYSFPLSGTADDYITATSISDHSSFFYGGVTLSAAF